jgi:hypothetical protein
MCPFFSSLLFWAVTWAFATWKCMTWETSVVSLEHSLAYQQPQGQHLVDLKIYYFGIWTKPENLDCSEIIRCDKGCGWPVFELLKLDFLIWILWMFTKQTIGSDWSYQCLNVCNPVFWKITAGPLDHFKPLWFNLIKYDALNKRVYITEQELVFHH